MEVHTEDELDYANRYIDIIGINNRNLDTFVVDIETSVRLSEKIPSDFLKISESGISSVESIIRLKEFGFDGFLIGENFMKTQNPGKAFNQFIDELKTKST